MDSSAFLPWPWLIAVLVVAIQLVVIARATPVENLRRGGYAWRLALVLAVQFGIRALPAEALARLGPQLEALAAITLLALMIALLVWFMVALVRRLDDAGWPRWLALLLLAPGANLAFLLGMALLPPAAAAQPAPAPRA